MLFRAKLAGSYTLDPLGVKYFVKTTFPEASEGLRKIGHPNEYAIKYYKNGIDEIIYNDVVASLYNRNNIFNIIKETKFSLKPIQDVYK